MEENIGTSCLIRWHGGSADLFSLYHLSFAERPIVWIYKVTYRSQWTLWFHIKHNIVISGGMYKFIAIHFNPLVFSEWLEASLCGPFNGFWLWLTYFTSCSDHWTWNILKTNSGHLKNWEEFVLQLFTLKFKITNLLANLVFD